MWRKHVARVDRTNITTGCILPKRKVSNAQAPAVIPFAAVWHPSRDGAGA